MGGPPAPGRAPPPPPPGRPRPGPPPGRLGRAPMAALAVFGIIAGLGRGMPGTPPVPPGRGMRFSPPPAPPGRGAPPSRRGAPPLGRSPRRCWVPMPWAAANGLLPGRGAPGFRGPGVGPPGRPAPAPGRGPGVGAPGRPPCWLPRDWGLGPGACGMGTAGFGAAGRGAPGRADSVTEGVSAGVGAGLLGAGLGAAGVAGRAAAGLAAGFGAAGDAGAAAEAGFAGRAAGFATGRGAAGFGAEAAGLGASWLGALNASRTRRTTGTSSVEEGPRTYSPISPSLASSSLLVIPISLAISWTRGLATTLLRGPDRPRPGSLVVLGHRLILIEWS